jgi:hypothetical protein
MAISEGGWCNKINLNVLIGVHACRVENNLKLSRTAAYSTDGHKITSNRGVRLRWLWHGLSRRPKGSRPIKTWSLRLHRLQRQRTCLGRVVRLFGVESDQGCGNGSIVGGVKRRLVERL